jgi:hypothetical protein
MHVILFRVFVEVLKDDTVIFELRVPWEVGLE